MHSSNDVNKRKLKKLRKYLKIIFTFRTIVGVQLTETGRRTLAIIFPKRLCDISLRSHLYSKCSVETPLLCQNICNRTLTLFLSHGGGFGSEYVHVVLAFIYAALKQRRFRINSKYWNYGNYDDIFREPSESSERYCKPVSVFEMKPLYEVLVTEDHKEPHLVFSRFVIINGSYNGGLSPGFEHLRRMFAGPLYNFTTIDSTRRIVCALWRLKPEINETISTLTKMVTSLDTNRPFVGKLAPINERL